MEGKTVKRAANYTQEECWRLIDIVETLASTIENKKTDGNTWKEKKAAWQKISQSFNIPGTTNRTWEQLRSKYETLKKETRKAVAKCRSDLSDAHEDPFKEKLSPLHERIRNIIKLNFDGTPSQFDSEYLDGQIEPQSINIFIDKDIKSEPLISPTTSVTLEAEQIQITNSSIYTDGQLDPQSMNIYIDKDINHDGALISPSTSVTIEAEQIQIPNSSIYADANGIVEANYTRSHYSPVQLKQSKHPAMQTRKGSRVNKNINFSRDGRRMRPWLNVKADLAKLKMKLLQEEFDAKQRRENELHEQQCQINKQLIEINNLTIKKHLLQIQKILDV